MRHFWEAFLLGFLVCRLEVADVRLHDGVLVLLHGHELPDVFTHVCEVVLGELGVHELHEAVPPGLLIGGPGWDGGNATVGIGSDTRDCGVWIKVDGKNLLSDP